MDEIIAALEKRIEALESALAGRPSDGVIRAQRIEIVDDQGRLRMSIGLSSEEKIQVDGDAHDTAKKFRGAQDSAVGLTMFATNGDIVANLQYDRLGSQHMSMLMLFGDGGLRSPERASLGVADGPSMGLQSRHGDTSISIDDFGFHSIEMYDKEEYGLMIGAFENTDQPGKIERMPLATIRMRAPDDSVLWEISKKYVAKEPPGNDLGT